MILKPPPPKKGPNNPTTPKIQAQIIYFQSVCVGGGGEIRQSDYTTCLTLWYILKYRYFYYKSGIKFNRDLCEEIRKTS